MDTDDSHEARLRAVEQDASAARMLAGAADRDVSEFRSGLNGFRRATVGSLNALREDVTGLSRRMDQGFERCAQNSMHAAAGQQQIVNLLHTMIKDDHD